MRFRPAWLCTLFASGLVGAITASAQHAPKEYRVGEVSFCLPESWRTQVKPEPVSSGVVFVGDGGAFGRLTVAKLPSSNTSGSLLGTSADAMSAPETAELRIALEESGLTPLSGSYTGADEGGVAVEALGFRCRAPDGREVLVLTTTWRGRGEGWRARLQYSEAAAQSAGSLLNGIRSSMRYRDAGTTGFGPFRLAEQPPPPEWSKLVRSAPPPRQQIPATLTTPPMPVPAAAAALDLGNELAKLLHEYSGSLVFIESGSGAGSGFVCKTSEGVHLLTNQHVLAGMKAPRFTRLDRTPITTGAGAAAVGHDLMRFLLQGEAKPFQAMANVEAEARVGDDVVVLGNGEGARVIQPLAGKLIGIGPDRVEVTSEFVPGNSGSPIIHVKTGKVIGIATYLIQRRFSELTNSNEAAVRRFGYRLDSAKQWQPLNWPVFQQDKETMDRVESTTRDLHRLIKEMQTDRGPSAASYSNSAISRAIRDMNAILDRKGVSAPDQKRAFVSFFSVVRSATQADVTQSRASLRYDFFVRALAEENQTREEMYKLFDRIVKAR